MVDARYMVRPVRYTVPESGAIGKLYLVYDLEAPEFWPEKILKPQWVFTEPRLLRHWLEFRELKEEDWIMTPTRIIPWREANLLIDLAI